MKVAFQGVRGAFSEVALREYFGSRVQPVPCAFSEQVGEALRAGRAQYGFLPVENSIAGPVGVNLDLLLKENVFAVAECYLAVRHCLLAQPGAMLKNIKTVYSHPIALAQCRDFIHKQGLKTVSEYDTAGAAHIISERGGPTQAAIASRLCAEVYGLSVLAQDIQSARRNVTRFLAFVRRSSIPAKLKMEKTSLAFAAHHRPGALLNCLKCFANEGLNLTRLESRPVPEDPFRYVFFVDVLGGVKDAAVKRALYALKSDAKRVKVLGSYPLARP